RSAENHCRNRHAPAFGQRVSAVSARAMANGASPLISPSTLASKMNKNETLSELIPFLREHEAVCSRIVLEPVGRFASVFSRRRTEGAVLGIRHESLPRFREAYRGTRRQDRGAEASLQQRRHQHRGGGAAAPAQARQVVAPDLRQAHRLAESAGGAPSGAAASFPLREEPDR